MVTGDAPLPRELADALGRMGLAAPDQPVRAERLTGGVSSEIWKVDTGGRAFCVKRALPKLQVADDWSVPVERNLYERRWYELADAKVPGCAPQVLGHDDWRMLFAMSYLDPAEYPLWKPQLAEGQVDLAFAAAVAADLAAIHAATAGDPLVAAGFQTGYLIEELRLDPYLRQAGRRHPDLADRLEALADRTLETEKALVHGDVSPKNILVNAGRPIFLDAECAWYGDPAFDPAFCLNHLLLKCHLATDARAELLRAFDAFAGAYLDGVDWEPRAEIEARIATLLPGLLLARIDGKSPVEYIADDATRDRVRTVARALLQQPVDTLAEVRAAWAESLQP